MATVTEIKAKKDYAHFKKGEVYPVYLTQWSKTEVSFFSSSAFNCESHYFISDLDIFLDSFALRPDRKKMLLKKFGRV